MDSYDLLKNGAETFGVSINQGQINKMIKFKGLVIDWNKKINLTSIVEDKEFIIKHFLDSISCLSVCNMKIDDKVLDIGTGAGFPGIPLKIMNPQSEFVLLDSLKKRIDFLDMVIKEIKLNNTSCIHGRAEDYAKDTTYRESFNWVISRAVSNIATLSEYCLPFVKIDGYFMCMKGDNYDEDLRTGKKAIETLGGRVEDIIQISLPYSDINHNIIKIKKVNNTPNKYPRKAGKPSKDPIL